MAVDWAKVLRALADDDFDWTQLNADEWREARIAMEEIYERQFATKGSIAKWSVRDDQDAFGIQIDLDPHHGVTLTIGKPGGVYDGEPNAVTIWTYSGEHEFIGGESVESFREWAFDRLSRIELALARGIENTRSSLRNTTGQRRFVERFGRAVPRGVIDLMAHVKKKEF
jgi:hypothetical protein